MEVPQLAIWFISRITRFSLPGIIFAEYRSRSVGRRSSSLDVPAHRIHHVRQASSRERVRLRSGASAQRRIRAARAAHTVHSRLAFFALAWSLLDFSLHSRVRW